MMGPQVSRVDILSQAFSKSLRRSMCDGPKFVEEISQRPALCQEFVLAEPPKNRSTSVWPSNTKNFASNGQAHTRTMPGMANQFRSKLICLSDMAVLTWIGTALPKLFETATKSTPTQSAYGFATSMPRDKSLAAVSNSPTVPLEVDFMSSVITKQLTPFYVGSSLSLKRPLGRQPAESKSNSARSNRSAAHLRD